ncbi:MAG: hypothetical protein OCD02_01780 [Spirochaetaceae bacterium]
MNYKFHKPITIQLYGYLALIPFIFALFPILESKNRIDIILYSIGISFMLIILVLNHLSPMIRVTSEKLILYNTFSNRPITHLRKDITQIKKIKNSLILLTIGTKSIEIRLSSKKANKLITILEEAC